MVIFYFYLLFTLFSWQIYSKSSSGSLPGLTLLFRSQMSVTPFVLGALLPLGHRDCVTSWSQACFSWGSLLPIRVSFQGIRILEQVYGGSTVLATVCLERLYSTCALEWSLELAVLSEVWRYSFIVFKFPVFLLTSWSWSFVCKLLALFPARQESFRIILLSSVPQNLMMCFGVGLFTCGVGWSLVIWTLLSFNSEKIWRIRTYWACKYCLQSWTFPDGRLMLVSVQYVRY